MARAGLTTPRVVDDACVLADEVGLAKLTLAALADRLGVRQPSLYKHIDGMPGLQRAISIQAKNELAAALSQASVGKAREEAVQALADAYRAWALQYPGRYAATVPAPPPGDDEDIEASGRVLKTILDILAGFGLDYEESIHAHRALRSAMHGFVSLELGGGFGIPLDVATSYRYLIEDYCQGLRQRAGAMA